PPQFLLIDFLRYKPVIVVQGLFLVTNYVLLCFAPSLTAMTFLQFNYAVVTSTEVAYFSYIYSVIPPAVLIGGMNERPAMLTGSTLGATLGQLLVSLLLVSLAGLDYFYLNASSLGILSVAFLISVWLPIPQRGVFFRGEKAVLDLSAKIQVGDEASAVEEAQVVCMFPWSSSLWSKLVFQQFTSVYSGSKKEIIHCCCPIGAATAFCVGHVKVTWNVWGELSLGVFSPVGAGAVFLIGLTSNIWASYAGYIIFKCYLFCPYRFQNAANLSMACYGEVNTFVELLLQTILTAIVVDETALGLDIVTQFGSYYGDISVLFLIQGMYTACAHHCRPKQAMDQEQKDEPKVEVPSSDRFCSDHRQ
uniref:Solute carrier family 19 member 3b n=1 Tax=Hucho hucho TaxID=62062 RepID=A0A4W5PQA1_9TELE